MLGSGHIGLHNIGNTCYLNAIVQCLSHTQALRDYCLTKTYLQDMCSTRKPQLMNEFTNVLEQLWCTDKEKNVFTPKCFYSVFEKDVSSFRGKSQQDAQEFLLFLLNRLHTEIHCQTTHHAATSTTPEPSSIRLRISKKADAIWRKYLEMDDSIIVDLFAGQLCSLLCCSVCAHCSITFDMFRDLSLSIPKTSNACVTLRECLNLFSQEEKLNKENSRMCKTCNHRSEITKRLCIQRFPKILVIHLKRFTISGSGILKSTTPVTFPLTDLDLRSFGAGDCGSALYDLYALCSHTGNMNMGHYIAVCKDGEGWYCYDDWCVTRISEEQLLPLEAYLLFYRLKTK